MILHQVDIAASFSRVTVKVSRVKDGDDVQNIMMGHRVTYGVYFEAIVEMAEWFEGATGRVYKRNVGGGLEEVMLETDDPCVQEILERLEIASFEGNTTALVPWD